MLGIYEQFPLGLHSVESFNSKLPTKQLQQRLIRLFHAINNKEFTFEEIANPAIPNGIIIFEFGIADNEGFNYINDEEAKKALDLVIKENLRSLDFFCAIRYYRKDLTKKSPLKFDYYLLRTIFAKESFEIQVHHERGPRHISPAELTQFIGKKANEGSRNIILKKQSQ